MIIFFEDGRLGNQFFQYFGLKSIYKNHKILLVGFKPLFSLIEIDSQICSMPVILEKNRLKEIFKLTLQILAFFRLVSESKENCNDSNIIITRKGFFSRIIYFSAGYFQNTKYFSLDNEILFKSDFQFKFNKGKLEKLYLMNKTPVFIHIRRGDYLGWPNSETPAVLGLNWYKNQIELMQKKVTNSFFIIFTDDVYYVKDYFEDKELFFISNNNEIDDFLLMTVCEHGILSASSFAFWAALLIKQRNPDSILVAPNYWAGHRSQEWFPKNFETDWLIYK